MRANNFDTVNACDGYSAIALAQKEKPNLIILDLGLPAGDGFSVLKNLQQYPALSTIPVIVLTARDPEGNEKRTLQSGAVAFFQKPADNEELLGVMRASLQRAGLGWSSAFVGFLEVRAGRARWHSEDRGAVGRGRPALHNVMLLG